MLAVVIVMTPQASSWPERAAGVGSGADSVFKTLSTGSEAEEGLIHHR